jgi:hypothetical protein
VPDEVDTKMLMRGLFDNGVNGVLSSLRHLNSFLFVLLELVGDEVSYGG